MTEATDLPDESSGESGQTPGEGPANKPASPRTPRTPRKTSSSRTTASKTSGSSPRTPRKPAAKRPTTASKRPASAAKPPVQQDAASAEPEVTAVAGAPVDPALEAALESITASETRDEVDETVVPEADETEAADDSVADDSLVDVSVTADSVDSAQSAVATIDGSTDLVSVEAEDAMPEPALVLRDIRKSFGDLQALDGISLEVPVGSFYGIVGPNGAGKTTTLSIVAGLLRADSGEITIAGVDAAAKPVAAKRLMGVLPDRFRTFDRLTGRQLLYYYGALRGLPPAEVERRTIDLARAFDLTESLGRVVSDYSAGMSKKIMLAGALIHSPRVLVLDEPFEAVDPVSSAAILDILQAYVAHGGTVILSSHGMELVERVCSRVAVIVAGSLVAEGSIDEVRGEVSLEERFVELVGGAGELEGLEWLHTFSD
ncbi:ATP-binding cassette domain-containing protein [Microbacterium sp. 67-17]|uniref:ABC transporter ATP-binding protein n=1 Tax=Microbacterium sp. 67-17 TaxID=1895782 RepID=UPI0025D32B03|nr:ATP-binding cassette domain-containing protein [Microbacterium sp. 67-17]